MIYVKLSIDKLWVHTKHNKKVMLRPNLQSHITKMFNLIIKFRKQSKIIRKILHNVCPKMMMRPKNQKATLKVKVAKNYIMANQT